MNGIQTQITGRQEATGPGGHALSPSLSPSLGNSEAKPEGPNAPTCGHDDLNAVDHRTVNGEEYTRWVCLVEGCDVDYWADSDGNEVDPEDVDEEAAGEEEEDAAASADRPSAFAGEFTGRDWEE